MGTAHAGHDQCAHCYFTYIKPQITEERQRVKGRRALKRRLSAENRQLISEVDLKEPLPRIPDSIRNAIFDIELDRLIENKTPEEASDAVTHELQKIWTDVPVVMDRLPQKEEPPVQETVPEPTPLTRHPHKGSQTNLSPDQVAEVADAYVDGMAVLDICNACNIVTTTLYAILRERGIALRGRPGRKDQSTMPVSPTPVEKTPTNGVVSELTEWTVTYTVVRTETIVVAAKGFSDAASAARASIAESTPGMSDVEVIAVAKKRGPPGTASSGGNAS